MGLVGEGIADTRHTAVAVVHHELHSSCRAQAAPSDWPLVVLAGVDCRQGAVVVEVEDSLPLEGEAVTRVEVEELRDWWEDEAVADLKWQQVAEAN